MLSASAAGGALLGKHTRAGQAVSGPVCALLLAWAAHVCGVLPPPGPHFGSVQAFCASLATPLLLLGADLRFVLSRTRRLAGAFALACAGTTLGAVLGFHLLRGPLDAGPAAGHAWKLAAALLAKNVGSGLNYIAVASTLEIPPPVVAAGLVVDNLAGLVYFPLISFLGRAAKLTAEAPGDNTAASAAAAPAASPPATTEETLTAVALACCVTAAAQAAAPAAALPAATALAVALATALPRRLARVAPAGEAAAQPLLFLFFACAGATAGDPRAAVSLAPWLAFDAVLYGVHLLLVLGAGGALGLGLPERLLASNAAVGGVGTAAALADARGWAALRAPAVLAACLGNAVATFLGLGVGAALLRGAAP